MADDIIKESDEVQETDIVFDCPHCGKSLCIDYHGAGLNVVCIDCGQEAVVPIPEGMELDDLDSSPQDQEVRIINLRNSLAQADARVRELETELETLKADCQQLKAANGAVLQNGAELRERILQIKHAQADIYRALDGLEVLVGLEADSDE